MATELEEKEAIRELLSSYCFHIDTGNLDAFTALFVEDCVWDGPAGRCASRKELRDYMIKLGVGTGPGKVRHLTLNVVISVTGETATARSYSVVLNAAVNPPTVLVTAFYEDRFVKLQGRWLFKERVAKL